MGTSKKRKSYTPEYRREATRLVIDTDRTIAAVAREIGVGEDLAAELPPAAVVLHADEDLAVLRERDDGWGGATALGVRDDRGLATLEDGDGRVGGSEVDANGTGHEALLCSGGRGGHPDAG